jgi:hypothetical protein
MISNEIRFARQQRGDDGPLVIIPSIDGAPLTELIDRFEIAAGMHPACKEWSCSTTSSV